MSTTFLPHPLPVKTPLGEGFVLYVTEGSMWANDAFCVVLDNGTLRHFTTEQLEVVSNGTYGIQPHPLPARTERMYPKGSAPALRADDPLAVHSVPRDPNHAFAPCGRSGKCSMQPEEVTCFDCVALGNGWKRTEPPEVQTWAKR